MTDKTLLPEILRVLLPDGSIVAVKLETYLAGVVAAEMSVNAPLDALKAQAVASRTYAASARRHPEVRADVCAGAHCQRWKRVDPLVAPEVFRAVDDTAGIVAVHDGNLIDAYYFEHCDGKTRSADQVLTHTPSYLASVECPCGFVKMRGHGLGLCQRGAIVMARRGASFDQILRYYYRGISIVLAERSASAPRLEAVLPVPRKIARRRKPQAAPKIEPRLETETPPVEGKPAAPPPPVAPQPPAPSLEDSTAALMKEVERLRQLTQETMREVVADSTVKPLARVEPIAPESVALEEPAAGEEAQPMDGSAPAVEEFGAPLEQMAEQAAPMEMAEDSDRALIMPRAELPAEETPSQVARRVVIDHLPGARMIAGCLPHPDIAIVIEDVEGAKQIVFSGSAAHYGAGGFETSVEADGRYFVTVGKYTFEVSINDDTAFIHAEHLHFEHQPDAEH
jgi:hypothetical protein